LVTSIQKLIRKHIVNSFAIGVVVISSFVLGYIFYELTITKEDVATQIISQKSERINSELNEFFVPIEKVMRTLKDHNGFINIIDLNSDDLNLFYISIISEYPQISSIGLAHSSGYEINILPDTIEGYWVKRQVYVDAWGMIEKWTRWRKTETLTEVSSWESALKVDPRERSWFKGAASNSDLEIFWTEPYEYMTGDLGITSSMRYPDFKNVDEFNIIALDITLTDMSNFSNRLSLSNKDEIYILTGDMNSIIGLPQKYQSININTLHSDLLYHPNEFGNESLIKLIEFGSDQIVSFSAESIKWWGILKQYPISLNQQLVLAALVPERDFSVRIDRTRSLMGFGFLIVISLSTLLLRNNDKLRQAGNELNQKNELIMIQRQHLLEEVHHRVKNNLAIMSALMELENMMIDDAYTNRILSLIQSRILSMSAVHEVLYKSDQFNRIQVQDILPGITNHFKKNNADVIINYKNQVEPVHINVNQALTYGLLINEYLNWILKSRHTHSDDCKIGFEVKNEGDNIRTIIDINFKINFIHNQNDIGFEIISVLIAQLDATLTQLDKENGAIWVIDFKLDDKKGITSDKNYNS
jgi:two-component sensor histidine kinase